MLNLILTTLYYALPGLVANMMPIFVRGSFKFLGVPVDNNIKFRGKPLFGSHKTYRGFIFGIIGGMIISFTQMILYKKGLFLSIAYLDYSKTSFVLIGVVLGFGALFGDLAESFFKRRINKKEGARFFPWDQLDYVMGIIVFAWLLKPMSWQMIIVFLIIGPVMHILMTRAGYYLKIRKEKW